ncbi:MAG: DapH/DapD/GlmU-related protein, partial [Bacteroidetes bacterium]|nr:DapH/DapD/GlmU-related protein [Bacteroidota bacterium]
QTLSITGYCNFIHKGSDECDNFLKFIGKKCEAFVAVEETRLRKGLVKMLKERCEIMPTNAIHNHAIVPKSAHIGYGNFIDAGVVIGAGAKVPNHCVIHSNATVGYGVVLSDFVQIGAGSIINGEVIIREGTFIGSGVTIVSGVTIGKNARIGAGSVVITSVVDGETVFGNPAQTVKK